MSIINEALKKIQNQITPSTITPANDATADHPQTELTPAQQAGFQPIATLEPKTENQNPIKQTKNKQPRESHLVFVLGILCLLTGLFVPIIKQQSLFFLLVNQITKKSETKPKTAPAPKVRVKTDHKTATTITPTTVVENTPLANTPKESPVSQARTTTKPQSRIIINGIMTRGEQNLALIDGQIYEEGTEVDGVKILKITPKGVTLLEDGEERFVKVMGL